MNHRYDIIIIGGGAAGFFSAINIAEHNPAEASGLKIAILERGKDVLEKVRISGGGRCNVAHACFEPNELIKNYPRGEKELRGPFHVFSSADTVAWFEKRGVAIKAEADGRMFPVSNSSQTIIDCFLESAKKLKIEVLKGQSAQAILNKDKGWEIETPQHSYFATHLIVAAGSNPKVWEMVRSLGHTIVKPVPSLFTFNITDPRIASLPGISVVASVVVKDSKLASRGPLLITHWGMSGPAILKLSAWGARILNERNYNFTIFVNWLNDIKTEDAISLLKDQKSAHPKKAVSKNAPVALPTRLWESLVLAAGISEGINWADLSKAQIITLANQLTNAAFHVDGKSTFKEEFVTAGGIDLKEINFKTMQSKLHENLYFAGEVVNIDAITGGFNFQNAWTSGYVISKNFMP